MRFTISSFCQLIFLSFILVLISSCGRTGNRGAIKASGTIEATEVNVASKVGAQVNEFRLEEGSAVKEGDTLAVIDHSTLDFQLRQAEANADVADAQLKLLVSGSRSEDIEQAQENLKQAEANLGIAKDDLDRVHELFETKVATQREKDNAEARYTVALAQYNSSRHGLRKVKQLARPEEIRAAEARLAQARASADLLKKTISDCHITAPVPGILIHKAVEVGELVGQGATVATISKLSNVDLMIYVNETELGRVKLGSEAQVRTDTDPKRIFRGKVVYISPVAEFTPKNVQTKEDRVKLVFGVKIAIDNPDGALKPGMPADAAIKVVKISSH
ncbi:MAG: efflux RND transporter periplasmic adaptor subunit [Candidatus Eisenbacteria bacterium]|nr:efflux RND transporter periplasmic adaptor subunit [Candidatus Eisenbacteria bacterium]